MARFIPAQFGLTVRSLAEPGLWGRGTGPPKRPWVSSEDRACSEALAGAWSDSSRDDSSAKNHSRCPFQSEGPQSIFPALARKGCGALEGAEVVVQGPDTSLERRVFKQPGLAVEASMDL